MNECLCARMFVCMCMCMCMSMCMNVHVVCVCVRVHVYVCRYESWQAGMRRCVDGRLDGCMRTPCEPSRS